MSAHINHHNLQPTTTAILNRVEKDFSTAKYFWIIFSFQWELIFPYFFGVQYLHSETRLKVTGETISLLYDWPLLLVGNSFGVFLSILHLVDDEEISGPTENISNELQYK